jgi:nucleoside 2-deoxyribosyltransferase
MKSIYFAGPLFCDSEKYFNERLAKKIEDLGFNVFLPQRDGVETDKAPYDKMEKDERRKAMFDLDRNKILESDIFLFVLDGRIPDEGACVELGIAYARKYFQKTDGVIIGLHTDSRAAFLSSKLNPMIKMALDRIFENETDLLGYLKDLIIIS